MNIYDFITPSDPITFKAKDDKIALCCALLIGNGKVSCKNLDTGKSVPSLLIFSDNPEKAIDDFLGENPKEFINSNKSNIIECLESFAYVTHYNRARYDADCASQKDLEELKKFKDRHEERKRTSTSGWVKAAWDFAQEMAEDK